MHRNGQILHLGSDVSEVRKVCHAPYVDASLGHKPSLKLVAAFVVKHRGTHGPDGTLISTVPNL